MLPYGKAVEQTTQLFLSLPQCKCSKQFHWSGKVLFSAPYHMFNNFKHVFIAMKIQCHCNEHFGECLFFFQDTVGYGNVVFMFD